MKEGGEAVVGLKLDICGGSFPFGNGYLNVDARPLPGVDVVADLLEGLPFESGSVVEIVSCGTLEHFTLEQISAILDEMFRVLQEGGKLIVGVPDLQALMEAYLLQTIDFSVMKQYLYGQQANPLDLHRAALDVKLLTRLMAESGFGKIKQVPYNFPYHESKYMFQLEGEKSSLAKGETVTANEAGEKTVAPDQDMAFSGERLVPHHLDLQDLYIKHIARYDFAAAYVAGCRVLDAGCGCGYGAYHLAAHGAGSVCGLDQSAAAISYARSSYPRPNLSFMVGDVTELPFVDNYFDVVVSFELIEHLEDAEVLLQEVERVVKPGGLFIVSTPNRRHWQDKPKNPYHYREYALDEFRGLLGNFFQIEDFLGQNIGSGFQARKNNEDRLYTFLQNLINHQQQADTYHDRQLSLLRDSAQDTVTALRNNLEDALTRLRDDHKDALIRLQNEVAQDYTRNSADMLTDLIRELPSLVLRSTSLLLPERLKRLCPTSMREWLIRRLELKCNFFGQRWAAEYVARWREANPPKTASQETPAMNLGARRKQPTGLAPIKRLTFPMNKFPLPVRPPLESVPFQLADMEIRPENVAQAMYFIVVCRKNV